MKSNRKRVATTFRGLARTFGGLDRRAAARSVEDVALDYHEAAQRAGEVHRRSPWLTRAESIPWAALLVSEQTRQFYAYKNIPEGFLAHVFGVFRMAMEEHLPLDLINDWDLNQRKLNNYRVLEVESAPNVDQRRSS